jgi:molybdopterin-guanine dinucleotide biosynthesis protein A
MLSPGQLTGAVLAGGQSRRMGRDKAMLAHEGRPMWARQAGVLREAGADPVAIVRAPGQPPLGLPEDLLLWHDTVTDAGPLAGLQVALTYARTSLVAVLAVDMPRIDAWWFQWLGSFSGSTIGAIACRPDGACEPLAALYPRIALGEISLRLTGPDRSLQSLATALVGRQLLRRVPLPENEQWRVANWNCPTDTAH